LPLLERSLQLGSEVYDQEHSLQLAASQIALASCLLDLHRGNQAPALAAKAKAIQSTYKDLADSFRTPLRRLEARISTR
jgi:hypothetical protein